MLFDTKTHDAWRPARCAVDQEQKEMRRVKIKKTIGGLVPDVSGHVTHLHDCGHDIEENHFVKKQVAELKRIVFFLTYKRHEGVYGA